MLYNFINCLQISRNSSRKLQHSLTCLSVLRLLDCFFPHRYPISFCVCEGINVSKFVGQSILFILFSGCLADYRMPFTDFCISLFHSKRLNVRSLGKLQNGETTKSHRTPETDSPQPRVWESCCCSLSPVERKITHNSAPRCDPSSDCHAGVTPSR